MRRRRTSHAPAGADSRLRVLSDSNGSRAADRNLARFGWRRTVQSHAKPARTCA